LGLAQPSAAWRWALAEGLWIPLAHLICPHFGIHPRYAVKPNEFAAFLAMIPAMMGAYAGSLGRMAATA
jgi:hypothetical protein